MTVSTFARYRSNLRCIGQPPILTLDYRESFRLILFLLLSARSAVQLLSLILLAAWRFNLFALPLCPVDRAWKARLIHVLCGSASEFQR